MRLNLPSGSLELEEHVAETLRDTAAAMAGRSSAARDLSLILERAIIGGRGVALRRAEIQTLLEVADVAGVREIREQLA